MNKTALVTFALAGVLFVGMGIAVNQKYVGNAHTQVAQAVSLSDGLIAHYPLDTINGDITPDVVGPYHGTLTGTSTTVTSGKVGSALSLDGDDSVKSATNFADNISTLTVSFWVKTKTTGNVGIFLSKTRQQVTAGSWEFGRTGAGVLNFNVVDSNNILHTASRYPVQDTNWHHVVGIYDGSKVQVYVDGLEGVASQMTGNIKASPQYPVCIGARSTDSTGKCDANRANIDIDDIRIYNRAISGEEICKLYELGGGSCGSVPAATPVVTVPQTQPATQTQPTSTQTNTNTQTQTQTNTQTQTQPQQSTTTSQTNIDPAPTTIPLFNYTGPATVIGKDALKPFPTSGLWNSMINFIPGNKEVVTSNPPMFSWPYDPDTKYVAYAPSRTFLLQVDDNADFSSPIVNYETIYNMYAYAPDKFVPGTTYYWRVGYKTKTQNNYSWRCVSPQCTFTISPNATKWDRSKLGDATYLQQKLAPSAHPYLLFNVGNRKQLYTFLSTAPVGDDNGTSKSWAQMKVNVDAIIKSPWWGQSYVSAFVESGRAKQIADVAFVYQVTKEAQPGSADAVLHARLKAANPHLELIKLSQWIMREGSKYWMTDVVSNSGYTTMPNMSYAYDWLYDLFATDQQKADARKAIEWFATWLMDYSYRDNGVRVITSVDEWMKNPPAYTGDYQILPGSLLKMGHSHTLDNYNAVLRSVIGIAGDSPKARSIMDFALTYMLVKGTPYTFDNGGIISGRSYGAGSTYQLDGSILYKSAFPEIPFEKNPRLVSGIDWSSRMMPVNFTEVHQPWGDGGDSADGIMSTVSYGRNAAMFLQNSDYAHHFKQALPVKITANNLSDINLVLPAFYPLPSPQVTSQPLSRAMIQDGWAMGCSARSNTPDCYNGVGFIVQARPMGQQSHGSFGDLSYQLWAYGTTFTDAGGKYHSAISSVPHGHYTLTINGLGQAQSHHGQVSPYYSRIFAYETTPTYTYVGMEGTHAYPTKNFRAGNMDTTPTSFLNLHSNAPLKDLKKVHRHFFFIKNKYFIVFDDLASDEESTFSSLYHILESDLTFNDPTKKTSFSYISNIKKFHKPSYLFNQPITKDVKVKVAQIFDPDNIRVDHMTGADLYKNPFIPTENYNDTAGDTKQRKHALWFSNANKQKAFHFLTVIYPENPDAPASASIRGLDDYTVEVTNQDGSKDIISFNPSTATKHGATIVVDIPRLVPPSVDDPYSGTTVSSLPYVPPTQTAANTDTDGDGVPNTRDLCPNTAASQKSMVNSHGCAKPKLSTFDIFPNLDVDLRSLTGVEIGKSIFGKIKFNQEIQFTRDSSTFDVDSGVKIEKNRITVDSLIVPELDKPATVTLYNVTEKNPKILKDGKVCTECKIISHINNTLIFTVPGF